MGRQGGERLLGVLYGGASSVSTSGVASLGRITSDVNRHGLIVGERRSRDGSIAFMRTALFSSLAVNPSR